MGEKILAVMGATGTQGGGLARAALSGSERVFSVRALTRHPESEKAKQLSTLGADVVFADADDIESLKRAFAGVYGAFCVTNFWEHLTPDRELVQATAIARAAACAGLQHVVWSTLEDTRQWVPLDDRRMPTLRGQYKVPHFDAKGQADAEFRRLGVPTTFFLTSFYWDNLINFPGMGLQYDVTGTLVLSLPMDDKKLPGIAAEDIGRCTYGVFKAGREYLGRRTGVAGEHLTGAEMASKLTAALGERVEYVSVPPEKYRVLNIPNAADLANMFQFKRDFQDAFCSARSVELARVLNPSLQTFDRWLAVNANRLRPSGRSTAS